GSEPDVGDETSASAAHVDHGHLPEVIPGRVDVRGFGKSGSNPLDSLFPQAEELFGARATIGVNVDPQSQLVEDRIASIDDAIAIRVVLREGQEAVRGRLSIRTRRAIPEELATVLNRSVAVHVASE